MCTAYKMSSIFVVISNFQYKKMFVHWLSYTIILRYCVMCSDFLKRDFKCVLFLMFCPIQWLYRKVDVSTTTQKQLWASSHNSQTKFCYLHSQNIENLWLRAKRNFCCRFRTSEDFPFVCMNFYGGTNFVVQIITCFWTF